MERWVGYGGMGKKIPGKGPEAQRSMTHSESVCLAGPDGLENEVFISKGRDWGKFWMPSLSWDVVLQVRHSSKGDRLRGP